MIIDLSYPILSYLFLSYPILSYLYTYNIYLFLGWVIVPRARQIRAGSAQEMEDDRFHTVDGGNPAPVDRRFIKLFVGFQFG